MEDTIAAIKAAAPAPGGIVLRPDHMGGHVTFWETPDGWTHRSEGATEAEALDNLRLVVEGKGDEVDRAIRLKEAQARETEAETAYDAAKAAREAIEAER